MAKQQTTKVRMRQQISGTRNGSHWPVAGKTVEVSDDEAEVLIRLGLAEAAKKSGKSDDGDG